MDPQEDGWGTIEDETHNELEEPIEFFMNKEISPPSDDEPHKFHLHSM
jgi:hypothetical protein